MMKLMREIEELNTTKKPVKTKKIKRKSQSRSDDYIVVDDFQKPDPRKLIKKMIESQEEVDESVFTGLFDQRLIKRMCMEERLMRG